MSRLTRILSLIGSSLLLPVAAFAGSAPPAAEVGIVERLGNHIPSDVYFKDESGRKVRLRSLISKPTVLSLVYFECPGLCTPVLQGVATALRKMPMTPGRDYQVITVSFNEKDTPELAKGKKATYLKEVARPFPPEAWKFLTGDQTNIQKLTSAVGFKYQRRGDQFVHTAAIYILAPDGKIVRYLYGTEYLPFDMKMALTEAAQGHVFPTINRVILTCFSYDPGSHKYVMNITRVAGGSIVFLTLLFVIFVGVAGKKRDAGHVGGR